MIGKVKIIEYKKYFELIEKKETYRNVYQKNE